MIKTFADALMSAEAHALCNAEYGQVSDERGNHRSGYRLREWDTRAGTVELAVPKLRQGSYFPHWLLERRRRAEQALISVVATAYLLGVSTRRVEKLAESLGVTQLSKSQVSAMAKHLDEQVAAFRRHFQPLLAPIDLDGDVLTFDALHSVKANVAWLAETKKAHYVAVIKPNQPTAWAQLDGLDWHAVAIQHTASNKGHGRCESRSIKTLAIADNLGGIAFPHAKLALRVHRRRKRPAGSRRARPSMRSPASTSTRRNRPNSPPTCADTGPWKPSTTSATVPSPKTPPLSTPATYPASWPPSATSRSEPSKPSARPTSRRPPAPSATKPNEPSPSWASPTSPTSTELDQALAGATS